MKKKCSILTALIIVSLFAFNCLAVNVRDIDNVRNKPVLADADLKVIDSFLLQAVAEIENTNDFSSISKTLAIVISRQKNNTQSSQAQYQAQFSESANKYIPAALKSSETITPPDRALKVRLNLLILSNALEDLGLAKAAFAYLDDENQALRYWAVHNLTNEAIIAKFNLSIASNRGFINQILKKFQNIHASADDPVVTMISRFAGKIQMAEAQNLLIKIAQSRMQAYEKDQVGNALIDTDILTLLSVRIENADSQEDKALLGRNFGQYLSYVMQKYALADNRSDLKEQLASILVEMEKSCLGKLLDKEQYKIRLALSNSSTGPLMQEHDRLLGSGKTPGQLGQTLGFNYGKDKQGKDRLAPAKLPI